MKLDYYLNESVDIFPDMLLTHFLLTDYKFPKYLKHKGV